MHIYNGMLWGHVCFVTDGSTFLSFSQFSHGSALSEREKELLAHKEGFFKKFKSLFLSLIVARVE